MNKLPLFVAGLLVLAIVAASAAMWSGDGAREAGPAPRDLAVVSGKAAGTAAPVWNEKVSLTKGEAGETRIIPPEIIIPGQFAIGEFKGETASWAGYDELALTVRCEAEGQLGIVLAEEDEGERENYMLMEPYLVPGTHSLVYRLAPEPEGDLVPSGPSHDGRWNPEALDGVQMILADYPRGFEITAMTLRNISQSQGEEKN